MIDLHLHSTHSDGTFSPADLVRMAVSKKLYGLSITDHDTASGTGEAVEEGRIQNISVISGMELSVFHEKTYFHLLAYGFDWKDKTLNQGLKLLQDSRKNRNSEILAKLNEQGINISEEELGSESGKGQTGRPHIACLLVKKGIVKTINQAFERYLKKGSVAYVSRFIYPVQDAINLIHDAGGITSMAHPVQLGYSLEGLPELLIELKRLGLDGLETFYPTQKGKIRKKLTALAKRLELLETGGSDYHGDIRSGTSMAGGTQFTVPKELLTIMKIRLGISEKCN